MPKLVLGTFQPHLESALVTAVADYKKQHGPLAPLHILVPTRLLALHLTRRLAPHANLRFQTLADFPTGPMPPPLGLELLGRQIARDLPADGYFAPIRETAGLATALVTTFTDLQEANLTPTQFQQTATTPKLRELAAAYATYCGWLTAHDYLPTPAAPAPPPALFLYGFYDLNTAQRNLIARLAPTAVFVPSSAPYAQPLLDWLHSLDFSPTTPTLHPATPPSLLSSPGEPAEVREAIRSALTWLRDHPGQRLHDIAILYRTRDQYDALLRDTLRHLNIPTHFRSGRPISEHPDARLLLLFLETLRTDYSRAAVLELAGYLGSHTHWDRLTRELGIIGGRQQWQTRLHQPGDLRDFVHRLFQLGDGLPAAGPWNNLVTGLLAAWRELGGQHAPVARAIETLAALDTFESPVTLATFTDYCHRVLDTTREPAGRFQDGGLFVSDIMGARGLSFSLVIVLGLVEKSFPRPIREDPLLLDSERRQISPNLPLKLRGHDEEKLLFELVTASARDQLVLSWPRLDPATARPRVPSWLLLGATGANDFESLEKLATHIPLSPIRNTTLALEEREFDLPVLEQNPSDAYRQAISPFLSAGLAAAQARWQNHALTRHDGLLQDPAALALLHERFVLEKLVISATSLENFFRCPFYYFQKHILKTEPWDEPEAALTIAASDLGSLYHHILEDYYRQQPAADLHAILAARFQEFEATGVTGFAAIWELQKQIIREEIATLLQRADPAWQPIEFERDFTDLTVSAPVRLRGKIDRIDRRDDNRLRVLDYKTGKFKANLRDNDFCGGEALQLPLYLLAAEKLFPDATVESAHYLYFTLRGGYRTIRFTQTALLEKDAELNRLLGTAAAMIRAGTFAQYAPVKHSPCTHCDYRPICGNGIHKLYERKCGDPAMTEFLAVKGADAEETA